MVKKLFWEIKSLWINLIFMEYTKLIINLAFISGENLGSVALTS